MNTSKIIKGVVGSGRYTITAPIIKEDYGLYLKIEGVELPETYQVDFSNSENSGTSVTMIGNADGVLIPRQFIDSGKDVFAFLYHVGEDFGRTVYKFRIPNKVRPDRTNEQPTPEEQSVIDQAISALNGAVAQTAQDVISADQSAQSAKEDADRAEQARDDASTFAQRSANSAQASADYSESAQASATASAQSASEAETARQETTSLVAEAQRYANASEEGATASANSASQAQTYANNASASAQSASTSASNASVSAQTASTKASEASTSAQTASAKASEASQSASQALTYKTGAESAKTASQTAQTGAEQARNEAVTAKDDAESAKADAESARDEAQSIVDGIGGALDDKADVITDTASGAVASFTDGADDLPLKSLVVNIDPVQDTSSGDPSPENICSISGWEGMQLNVNGTVIPISWQTEAGTVYGGKLDVLSGKLVVDRAMVDMGSLSWSYQSVYGRMKTNIPDIKYATSNNFPSGNLMCSMYVDGPAALAYRVPMSVCVGINTSVGVLVYDDTYTDETSFTTAVTGQTLCYKLATPITVQLTPQEVKSLLGTNNIFADTGDVSVEYRADTKLYIEKLTQPEEDDMIADSAITSGQFFMIGNSLYRALANIASGATITVGTNAQRVSLSDALNLVNA